MHASIAVVDMTNFTPAGGVDWIPGKQSKSLFLKTGRADSEGLWVPDGEILQTRAKDLIHLSTPWLIQLPLRGNTCLSLVVVHSAPGAKYELVDSNLLADISFQRRLLACMDRRGRKGGGKRF